MLLEPFLLVRRNQDIDDFLFDFDTDSQNAEALTHPSALRVVDCGTERQRLELLSRYHRPSRAERYR